jgi:hypothetical protein
MIVANTSSAVGRAASRAVRRGLIDVRRTMLLAALLLASEDVHCAVTTGSAHACGVVLADEVVYRGDDLWRSRPTSTIRSWRRAIGASRRRVEKSHQRHNLVKAEQHHVGSGRVRAHGTGHRQVHHLLVTLVTILEGVHLTALYQHSCILRDGLLDPAGELPHRQRMLLTARAGMELDSVLGGSRVTVLTCDRKLLCAEWHLEECCDRAQMGRPGEILDLVQCDGSGVLQHCLHLVPLTVLSRWLGEQREVLRLTTRAQLLGRNRKRSKKRLEGGNTTIVDLVVCLADVLEESVNPLGIVHLLVLITCDQEPVAELVKAVDNLAQQTPHRRGDEDGAPCLILDCCGLLD